MCNFYYLLVVTLDVAHLLPFSRYWRILLENSLFSPPNPCLTLPGGGTSWDQRNLYTAAKYIPSLTTWAYLHSFRCWLQMCQIPQTSGRIRIYVHPRSSMLVGVSRKLICDFLLVINSNFDVSLTVFEIGYWPLKLENASFPTPLVYDTPLGGKPVKISGSNLSFQDMEGWRYRMV